MGDKYIEALHQAQAEMARLEERRSVLLRLIANLKELAEQDDGLAFELTPPPGYVPKGLTEEIRTVLSLTTVHLNPVQIRDVLIRRGVAHSSPKNLLINVHTVLSRLHDARKLDVVKGADDKPAFKLKTNDSD
ncbi:MAG: hypothetical protein LAO06_11335 [Acidobacteriia bacterium]|nr:hypothetical protein [Terriglobia bacterium]